MNFRYILYSSLFICIVLIWVSSNVNWGHNKWKSLLESDAKGYYAYLPAVFIYQDLNFNFFNQIEKEKYYQEHLYYDYRITIKGRGINKYYCGTAIAQLPFFLVAHAISYALGEELDGYSKWYVILVNISAIFYHLLGIIFLGKTLLRYRIKPKHVPLILLTASLGTNLFAYTVVEPGMSHVFSFAFTSMFIYYAKIFFEELRSSYLIIMGLLLGIIVLCRPINSVLIFILPFISGSWSSLRKGIVFFVQKWFWSLSALFLFILVCSIQLIIYKISTGHFFVYSYGRETFNFANPHIIDILFSYRKGLFLYTPVFLVSMLGLIFLWRNSKFGFISCSLFLLLITYIFSSWWMWYYGGSFSSRVYVDYISIFMILLAIGFNALNKQWLRNAATTILVLLIVLCQIQTYQYRYYDIHYSKMTEKKYWEVFLMRNWL